MRLRLSRLPRGGRGFDSLASIPGLNIMPPKTDTQVWLATQRAWLNDLNRRLNIEMELMRIHAVAILAGTRDMESVGLVAMRRMSGDKALTMDEAVQQVKAEKPWLFYPETPQCPTQALTATKSDSPTSQDESGS